jgi:hypothetical protein
VRLASVPRKRRREHRRVAHAADGVLIRRPPGNVGAVRCRHDPSRPASAGRLALLASTYADPVRTAAGVVGQLDSAISALPAESDQVRILTVSTAAFFTDRLAGCRESLWRVVRKGREGGAAARTITALTLLGTDGFMSGDWGAAQQAADECLQACQTHGCPVRAWMPRTLHALLAAGQAWRGPTDAAGQPAWPTGLAGSGPVEEAGKRLVGERDYDSPTIWPSSSRSMRAAAGLVPSPGMVLMSPQIG